MSILEKKRVGQVSFEYLLLIAGALVMLIMLVFILRGNVFGPQANVIASDSGTIHSAIASIMPT